MSSAKSMRLEGRVNLHQATEREKNWSNKGGLPKKVKESTGMERNT